MITIGKRRAGFGCSVRGPRRQAGLSFGGFVIVAFLGAFVVLLGFKLMPAYIEYMSLKNVLESVVNDPELKDAQVRQIRSAYSRRANIANVEVVGANDIEVMKDGDRMSLSAAYSVKVPLVGNVSACLDFEASAKK